MKKQSKKAIVWVSTVLYILISLAIIGIVLAAVQPRINEAKNKAVIEQTIILMHEIDNKIEEVSYAGPGNIRSLDLQLKKGLLKINETNKSIAWELKNSAYQYSEPSIPININKINALTTETPEGYDIKLILKYNQTLMSEINTLQAAEIPYKIFFENLNGNISIYTR